MLGAYDDTLLVAKPIPQDCWMQFWWWLFWRSLVGRLQQFDGAWARPFSYLVWTKNNTYNSGPYFDDAVMKMYNGTRND